MLEVVEKYPSFQFVIAATSTFSKDYYQSFIKQNNVSFVFNEIYGLLSNAKAALVTSGTASLETALFKVPQVVCYKTNWLTYLVAKNLINIDYISLVNILLKKESVRELVQHAFNKKNLKVELDIILNHRESILNDYRNLSDLLNKRDASKNAAKFIFDSI
jgi:lipid-A-disaccharide synthase